MKQFEWADLFSLWRNHFTAAELEVFIEQARGLRERDRARAEALAEAMRTLEREMKLPENRCAMTPLQNCASLDEWLRRVITPALAAYRELE